MKISSAAITVATISLLSTTHAAPLNYQNGEISGRPHHRRGSDVSDISSITGPSRAAEALEELDVSFEPSSSLILPRIVNFIKRQVASNAAITSSTSTTNANPSTSSTSDTAGTQDQDLHTSVMSPDLEEYGFASESGPASALAPVMEVKE